jgi:hypothetical protein
MQTEEDLEKRAQTDSERLATLQRTAEEVGRSCTTAALALHDVIKHSTTPKQDVYGTASLRQVQPPPLPLLLLPLPLLCCHRAVPADPSEAAC